MSKDTASNTGVKPAINPTAAAERRKSVEHVAFSIRHTRFSDQMIASLSELVFVDTDYTHI
jgi:hypothetical protein